MQVDSNVIQIWLLKYYQLSFLRYFEVRIYEAYMSVN